MTKTFLPDYSFQRAGCDFYALYRFFEGEDWHRVCDNGSPSLYRTPDKAIQAAKDAMRVALNPSISGHRSASRAVIDAAEEFFQTKHEKRSREHTARKRGLREVVFVETRGKRYAKS